MRRGRIGVRTRLLIAVVGAVGLGLVVAVTAFSLLLGERMSSSATTLARAQAAAEASSLEVRHGALTVPEGPDDGCGRSTGLGLRRLAAPRGAARVGAESTLRHGRSQAVRSDRSTWARRRGCTRCRSCENGVRYGTAVAGDLPRPVRGDRAHRADRVRGARGCRPGRCRGALALDARAGAAPGLAHDGGRGQLERARPRPALRSRRALRRADDALVHARQSAGADRRDAPPRAALHRRAVARAAHPAGAREGSDGAGAAAGAQPGRVPQTRSRRSIATSTR